MKKSTWGSTLSQTDGDVAKKPEIEAFSLWIHDQPSTRRSTHQTGAWTTNGPRAMWSLPYFAPVIALRINLGDRMNVSNLTTMSPSMSGTNPAKKYLFAFGKPAGHREVAPREFDVHSRWKPAREQKRKEGEEEEEK